jgi:branched-chain amino acid transport system substrate-binding protein
VRKRLIVGIAFALAATLAVVAGGYASSEKNARPSAARGSKVLPSASCAGLTKSGSYKFIIASDLPMQGPNRPQTTQMVAAIKYLLRTKWHYKAGKYKVAYQACDDSTAETAKWNSTKCTENAHAYADDKTVIGVVGTFNSGCAKLIVPILNRAPGGPVAMVSPANTAVGLTVAGLGSNPGEPNIYYPTGKRNYARVVTRDDVQGPAGALWASKLKVKKVYILTDKEVYGLGVATTFKIAAQRLKLKVTGGPTAWDPKASSYEPLATSIKQSGAQAVYLGGIVCNNGAQLIKGLRAVLGTKVKLIGPDGWTPFESVAAAGTAANGMLITVPGAPPNALKGTGAKFVKAFRKSIGGKELAPYAAYAAQAADFLLTAIKKSNGTRASVSSHLFNVKVKNGIIGTFKIDKNGDTDLAGITGYKMAGNNAKPVITLYPPLKLTKRS